MTRITIFRSLVQGARTPVANPPEQPPKSQVEYNFNLEKFPGLGDRRLVHGKEAEHFHGELGEQRA